MKKLLMLVSLVVVLGGVGCAAVESEGAVPVAAAQDVEAPAGAERVASLDEIAGWWKAVQGGDGVMHIEGNGTWTLFYEQEPMADGPRAMGEIRVEDSRFLIAENVWGDEAVCGDTGTYEVHLLTDGHIKFVAIEDNCQHRLDTLQGKGSLNGSIEWMPPNS